MLRQLPLSPGASTAQILFPEILDPVFRLGGFPGGTRHQFTREIFLSGPVDIGAEPVEQWSIVPGGEPALQARDLPFGGSH